MNKSVDEPIQIKRYPNRRFYAKQSKAYVSLGEIEEMIRDGKSVEIADSKTGEDITRTILTQIIMERQPEKINLFPSTMLHAILQANDQVSEFFRDYFASYLTYLDHFQKNGGRVPSHNPLDWMKAWTDAMMPFAPDFAKQVAPKPAPPGSVRADSATNRGRSEEELLHRLEEMEKRLRDLESESPLAD